MDCCGIFLHHLVECPLHATIELTAVPSLCILGEFISHPHLGVFAHLLDAFLSCRTLRDLFVLCHETFRQDL